MRQFQVGNRLLTDSAPAWVIAEIGHNHGGDVAVACDMIRIAKACGADAVKFQKRDNNTLYSSDLLRASYTHEHSYGTTYGEHRAALEFSRTEYVICQEEARRAGITCFATAFDEPSADFLADLQVPAIKIASGGLTDTPLLRHVASLGIPIILSTGGGTLADVHHAVNTVAAVHYELAILHCTAAYPVRDFADLNLKVIETYRQEYPDFLIGWSGHDNGIAMSVMAYTLGARIIEKHFTLNRANKGTDHAFSLEPSGLTKLCRDLRRAHAAYGDGFKRWALSEVDPIAKMRRRVLADGRMQITGARDAIHA